MATIRCAECAFQFTAVRTGPDSIHIEGDLGAFAVTCNVLRERLSSGPVNIDTDCWHIGEAILEATQQGSL